MCGVPNHVQVTLYVPPEAAEILADQCEKAGIDTADLGAVLMESALSGHLELSGQFTGAARMSKLLKQHCHALGITPVIMTVTDVRRETPW